MPPKPQPRHPIQGAGRGAGALLQFKITWTGIRPPIWRRVQVPEGLFLSGLHDVIQEVMGWTDSHVHDLHWREERFGLPDPEFDEERMVDARTVTLSRRLWRDLGIRESSGDSQGPDTRGVRAMEDLAARGLRPRTV